MQSDLTALDELEAGVAACFDDANQMWALKQNLDSATISNARIYYVVTDVSTDEGRHPDIEVDILRITPDDPADDEQAETPEDEQ